MEWTDVSWKALVRLPWLLEWLCLLTLLVKCNQDEWDRKACSTNQQRFWNSSPDEHHIKSTSTHKVTQPNFNTTFSPITLTIIIKDIEENGRRRLLWASFNLRIILIGSLRLWALFGADLSADALGMDLLSMCICLLCPPPSMHACLSILATIGPIVHNAIHVHSHTLYRHWINIALINQLKLCHQKDNCAV
jgi:hypothetical protein